MQRCTVHKHRNILAHAPKRLHEEITADYTDIVYAKTAVEVLNKRQAFLRKWKLKCRAVADSLGKASDHGIATPGLLAQVAVSKYLDHLPLYRQEAIYARSGVALGRTTLAECVGTIGVALQPLVAALRRELLTRPVLHADETPVAQTRSGPWPDPARLPVCLRLCARARRRYAADRRFRLLRQSQWPARSALPWRLAWPPSMTSPATRCW